jgi:hypothetical protein
MAGVVTVWIYQLRLRLVAFLSALTAGKPYIPTVAPSQQFRAASRALALSRAKTGCAALRLAPRTPLAFTSAPIFLPSLVPDTKKQRADLMTNMTQNHSTPDALSFLSLNAELGIPIELAESMEMDIPFDEDGEKGVAFPCFPGYLALIDMPEDLQVRRLLERAVRLIHHDSSDQLYMVVEQLDELGVDVIDLGWLRLCTKPTASSEGDYFYTVDLAARRQRFHSMLCLVRCGLLRAHEYSSGLIKQWAILADQLPAGWPIQRAAEQHFQQATVIEDYRQAVMARDEWVVSLSLSPSREKQVRYRANACIAEHDREVLREATCGSLRFAESGNGMTVPPRAVKARL